MKFFGIFVLSTMVATAMAKVRCQCSDDGNGINRDDTLNACQSGIGYGVEPDGFCYIIDHSRARGVLEKCPSRDFSYCQLVY
ncbi:hypothetical protein BGZ94_004854 [Podila epigama]|nr:hypothetical protein BGZ94_004854 [Podila epigama]